MESLLVAVDCTEASQAAWAFGIDLARRHNAALTGLAVLDQAKIAHPEPVSIGGMSYKVRRDEHLIAQEQQLLEETLRTLGQRCRSHGISYRPLLLKGEQTEVIEREALLHDLIIIGRDAEFHPLHPHQGRLSRPVVRILQDSPKPIIVTPPGPLRGQGILIVYDGTANSERLLSIVEYVGLLHEAEVEILCTADSADSAAEKARYVQEFLAKCGSSANVTIVKSSMPDRALRQFMQTCRARLVAISADFSLHWGNMLQEIRNRHLLNVLRAPVLLYR